ncbi:hypothetical protein O7599_31155 [Streptomyces sp. WMMC500]|uniref:hypothetical protein n=1 Tax=Streptomyces sp. WMMC500 TaxID=3015154 RepID=UPI00248AA1C3|nr:hypothetical protein [Streptomyces sp. WMMC500]WBB59958.1 hypothetical protein O7599_31155 [Streptomyces sp. WMMC500]
MTNPPPDPPARPRGPKTAVTVAVAAALLVTVAAVAFLALRGGGEGDGTQAGGPRPLGSAERPAGDPSGEPSGDDDLGGGKETKSASAGSAAGTADARGDLEPSESHLPYVVLRTGECFDHPSLDTDVDSVETRSCTGPHDGEVIGNRTLTGDFPDGDALDDEALGLCQRAAEEKLETMPADGRHYFYYALYPTLTTYEYQSQDEISCALTLSTEPEGPKLTGPLP